VDVDGGGLLVLVLVLDLDGEKRGRVARRLRLEVEGEGEELAAIGQDSWIGDRTGQDALQQPAASERPSATVSTK